MSQDRVTRQRLRLPSTPMRHMSSGAADHPGSGAPDHPGKSLAEAPEPAKAG